MVAKRSSTVTCVSCSVNGALGLDFVGSGSGASVYGGPLLESENVEVDGRGGRSGSVDSDFRDKPMLGS